MKRTTITLVVNADDFGLSESINKGILETYHRGIVRSTSLMPNGPAFDDAVQISKDTPGLGVGIHVSLVGERCVAPARELAGLVSADGLLPAGFVEFLRMFLVGRFSTEHIRREIGAQVSRVISAGIRPTHIDSHQHLHVFPGVIDAVLGAAKAASIPTIRIPREYGSIGTRNAQRMLLNTFCHIALSKIEKAGLSYAPHFWGFGISGSMTRANLIEIIGRLRPGVN